MSFKQCALTERKFPFLRFLRNNRLNIDDSVFSELIEFPMGLSNAKEILKHFDDKEISIFYVTSDTHHLLHQTDQYIENKSFLTQAPEMSCLILLPENLIPQIFDEDVEWEANQLKMNCILLTVLKWSTMDQVKYGKHNAYNRSDYDCDEDYEYEKNMYENTRWLNFLPIQLDKFFHVHNDSITAVDDEYGTSFKEFGRTINGNVIDYLWSLIIHYNLNVLSDKAAVKQNEISVDGDNKIQVL